MREFRGKLTHFSKDEVKLIKSAYSLAEKAHEGQMREGGLPFFVHPVAVAQIVLDLGLDATSVVCALLHDVVEDTSVTLKEIETQFGLEVANIVEGLTKLEKFNFESKEEAQAENFKKMFFAMSKDIRIILIKLADRIHNMRSICAKPVKKQIATAQETLDIYASIAGRLGVAKFKAELEDLAFRYLEPGAYKFLVTNVEKQRKKQNHFLLQVKETLKNQLAEFGINGEIKGRPKNLYSIFRKMKALNISLEEVYDLIAVRVIVETESECYSILGTVHKIYPPLPNRFKDYIVVPKSNKYQSLHTTVMTPHGMPIEIQIRTFEMDELAEYGVAAHWKYKEDKAGKNKLDDKIAWLRRALELEEDYKDSKEFYSLMKSDLGADEIVVSSPMGDLYNLRAGSTPIDFAYAVHSEVGNKCTGAKVNGVIVKLEKPLQNGDVVQIITNQNSKGPSRDWLNIAQTPSAKAKIRSFFKKQEKPENIKRGKEMLEMEAKRRGYKLSDLLEPVSVQNVMRRYTFISEADMFASVGYGGLTTGQVLFKLIQLHDKKAKAQIRAVAKQSKNISDPNGIVVDGAAGFLTSLAKCCNPVPGDEIVGYISRGRGVLVHRTSCPNVRGFEQERLIEATFKREADVKPFNVSLQVTAHDEQGVLADVASIIKILKLSMSAFNARTERGEAIMNFTVLVPSLKDLEVLLNKLRSHSKIKSVYRV
ncbi:MAG: bifunctional (p)ppGpp synthetase/guanosine-3',5'-bis(diphosphate) 3'-pyrophosphohydrolase [Firmicutes bacterium]|nr:bifunctional (p)ppGpp synthetase/guanosine-3',5'-bis(diphosphate) 3'-pyrophosphohydrolase [Bacillota bacterium]